MPAKQHRSARNALLCALLAGCLWLTGCGGDGLLPGGGAAPRPAYAGSLPQLCEPAEGAPIAIFETSLGEIRAQLFPDEAPLAVTNFTELAGDGYFDGLSFHRVVEGFVVQSGDATGTGLGGRTIWGRAYPVEYSGAVRHYAGALCAAFSEDEPVSGSSQFYMVAARPGSVDEAQQAALQAAGLPAEALDAYAAQGGLPYLDNTDTVFGQVYEGMEVVDAIAAARTDENGRPEEEIELIRVTLSTYSAADAAGADDADSAPAGTPASTPADNAG